MDYVLSTLQMQEAEKYTISKGIPSIDLMEKAGKAIFDTIINNIDHIYNKSILIVVGMVEMDMSLLDIFLKLTLM